MTVASLPARESHGKSWRAGSIRFRVLLGLTLAFVVLLAAGALLVLNGRAVGQMRSAQVDGQFEIVATTARAQVFAQFVSADAVLDTLAMSFPTGEADEAAGIAMARVLFEMGEASPAVLAVYLARNDGSYSLARKMTPAGRPRAEAVGARDAVFEVQHDAAQGDIRVETVTYLDASYKVVARTPPVAVSFDSRTRPWFTMAQNTDVAVLSLPYHFQDYDLDGITLSRRSSADPSAVFGVDLTLAGLSDTLRQGLLLPDEQVMVFEPAGALLGASHGLRGVLDLKAAGSAAQLASDPELARAKTIFAAYRDSPARRSLTLTVQGQEILADLSPFRFDNQKFVVASHVPADALREPLVRWTRWSLGVQALVVLLAVLLALRAAHLIAGPIGALTRDVESIVAFDFARSKRPASRIWEVRRLAQAVDTLEVTLRAFSTYLPAPFVRNIVSTKTLPQLGGRKETVVVLFSDITGFTALSESLPPDVLMRQMSRYLKELSDEILAAGGTVDKFIGDSVMAFWAGGEDPTHMARQACTAVLTAARRVQRLNETFVSEGLPPMPTRFGLHLGEAMVGSVGTLDRMNYTVLGHTVNVASRVEALNKTYGTSIMVTQAVAERCGPSFDVHLVDRVLVRGTREPMEVFELRVAPGAA